MEKKCHESTQKCENCKGEACSYSINWMSNTDLANTLLERTTFLGIIIRSEAETKGNSHQDFVVSCNQKMCPKDIRALLLAAADAIVVTSVPQNDRL
jgi:hypothetical protein